ncbi:hypothetical protein [Agitococcus lubricus]|uniref:Uncharacterized protein n=1 Tax=Agitococcus lubricus TaxID=1077255 RepID=A0A2T5INC7_9GAMM|nr:hypothetical protein [Agitococcus lubricus]PTQ85290.1 hypothetical protein C8N29_1533 [Agitococcus lubricus]
MRCVSDIINNINNLELVLVLESPFKDELIHNHPLAGKSGQEVTNYIKNHVSSKSVLRTFTMPMGCELIRTKFSKLGIVNCSLWPLDKKCYPCELKQKRNKTVDSFNLIRTTPLSITRKNNIDNRVEMFLVRGFIRRIDNIVQKQPNVVFVPCGDLADKFLSKCNLGQNNLIGKIPHP